MMLGRLVSSLLCALGVACFGSTGARAQDCTISLSETPRSWADAEADCVRQGGHLASIHSDADMELARSLVGNTAWIGLNDQ